MKATVLTQTPRHNQSIETVFLVYLYGQKRREMRVNCLANKDKAQANMVEHTISTRASPNTIICSSCLCASMVLCTFRAQPTTFLVYIYIYNEANHEMKGALIIWSES